MNDVLELLGEGGLNELKEVVAQLEQVEQLIVDINNESKRIDFGLKSAKNLKDMVSTMDEARGNMEKMDAAALSYAKAIAKADQAYKKLSDTQREEAMQSINADEAIKRSIKSRYDASAAARDAERAAKKRAADEERELNRLIAAEEKALLAKTREERRAAIAERKQAEKDYQNTWKSLLKERDDAERNSELARKKAAADAASKVAIDSNIALSRTLNELRNGYDRLSAAERENEHIGGVLQARIKELDTQLKATDAATGRFQRNVGNYAGAISPLQRQLSLVAGEIPNLQFGFRTFAASLSNQVQGVSDAIKETIAQNKLLKAESKDTTSVVKQIIGGFLNWQTAILVVAAALPILIEQMTKGNKAAQEAEKAQKKYTDAIESNNRQQREAVTEETSRMRLLVAVASDVNQTMRARILAVEELQKKYPSRFGDLTKEAILEGKVADAVRETVQALIYRGNAMAAEKNFTAANEKITQLIEAEALAMVQLDKAQNEYNKSLSHQNKLSGDALKAAGSAVIVDAKRLAAAKSELEAIRAERAKATQEARKYQDAFTYNSLKAGDAMFGDRKTDDERRRQKEKVKKELQDLASVGTDVYTQLQMQLDSIGSQVEDNTDKAIKELQKQLDAGVISVAEYERRKKAIIAQGERDILVLQVDAIQKALKNYGYSEETTDKIKRQLYDKSIALMKQETSEEEAQLLERAAIRKRFDEINEQNARGKKKRGRQVSDREALEITINAGLQFLDAVGEGVNAIYDAKIAKLQEINDLIDKNLQDEIAGINATTLTEEEKQRRIKEAEAKAQFQKEANERKMADIKVRQARLDKAMAIASVIQNTAVAVMKALSELPPPFGAIAATTYAATGAAQIATIAARPIPKYEKGTKDSEGGPAIVSEKGPELVIEPDGKTWMTPARESVVMLRKHSTIIPHHELIDMSQRAMAANTQFSISNEPVFDDTNIVSALRDNQQGIKSVLRELQQANAYNKAGINKTDWKYRPTYVNHLSN